MLDNRCYYIGMKVDDSHHAYFLRATSLEGSGLPESLLKQGADVLHVVHDSLGIDEARALIEQASHKAVSGSTRSFVILAGSMTLPAQNALLKLLEEPPEGAKFYLLLPDKELLIPTLQSRLSVLQGTQADVNDESFKEFVALSQKDRLALIADKTKDKDLEWINAIVSGAMRQAGKIKDAVKLTGVIFVASHINGPGASKKMLLEELALTIG